MSEGPSIVEDMPESLWAVQDHVDENQDQFILHVLVRNFIADRLEHSA